jgi:AraC-like DNA-binding protein
LISSDLFQGRERFDAWREEVSLRVLRVDLDAPDKNNFRREVRVLRLPNVTIMDRTTTSGSVTRTPALVRDGDDSLLFTFCWEGALDARFRKGHVQLTTGEGALVSSDMVGGLFAPSDCKSSTLRISRETGRSLASSVDDLFFRATRSDDPSLTILKAYLSSLQATSNGLSESMATLADRQIRELLAHIFNPAGDLSRSETYGGLRAARLQAILRELAVRIADPGLNAEGVGRRLGVSGRYVQQLLEGVGYSFSAYMRELRLERARQVLRDPLARHRRISDISEMAGFSDLSHFNRAFRTRCGETPTDARRAK